MILLEGKNLTLKLKGHDRPLFKNVSFQLEEGGRRAITGPSGSGKSLFLRCLCLLEEGLDGEIFWKGKPVLNSEITEFRSSVMYVGQKSSLHSGTVQSVFEEAFQLKIHRNKKWQRERTLAALEFFGKPPQFLSQRVELLSGGEKQLVHILRAVELAPPVLCMDEPTSALDQQSTRRIEDWLNKNFQGSWLWVTHNLEQAERIATQHLQFPL